MDKNANPFEQLQQLGDTLLKMTPALQKLSTILPKETLQWKLALIAEGCAYMNPKLQDVPQRVLVVVGEDDRLIPSKDEAPRLVRR